MADENLSMRDISHSLPSLPPTKSDSLASESFLPELAQGSEVPRAGMSNTILPRHNSFDSTAATLADDSPHSTFAETTFIGPHRVSLQSLLVIRHSERLDDVDESWAATSNRPWDPPITVAGRELAYQAGLRLRAEPCGISRVLVSPFFRCVQTAAEILRALAEGESQFEGENSWGASRLKVAIECGLGEMMNSLAMPSTRHFVSAHQWQNIPWTLPREELLKLIPDILLDKTYIPIQENLTPFGETETEAHIRFSRVFDAIADKFPNENVLCITHGHGVHVSVSRLIPVTVYEVKYCAFSISQRPIYLKTGEQDEEAAIGGHWELLTESGPTGVSWVA